MYFDHGYDYQYQQKNPNSLILDNPIYIDVLYGDNDSKKYAARFDFGRSLAKNDISKGYMNRVNPEFKPEAPILKVTDFNKSISLYIQGQKSTLMELYEFNKK